MTLRAIIWAAVSSTAQAEDERISLPKQEADALELCQREGWHVVDILRVPGHSRAYIDIHECARDMLSQGIDAFTRLLQHWERRDFDVFICRDPERFARTQTLTSYVVERTISTGARIYALSDGWIDQHNYRVWIAMAGYKSASDIDRLTLANKAGLRKRQQRGLSISPYIPMSHRRIRDPQTGREIGIELDETQTVLFQRVATLLLEGVAWHHLERELYERWGVVSPKTGKAWHKLKFHGMLFTPMFWGHIATNFRAKNANGDGYRTGPWIYDSSEPPPPGVTIEYDVIPAVYTGELAERVKAEMRRRSEIIRGKASPSFTRPFSGLCICAACGRFFVTKGNKWYVVLLCSTTNEGRARRTCPNTRVCPETRLQHWFTNALKAYWEGTGGPFGDPDGLPDTQAQQAALTGEIEQLERQIDTLIMEQSLAPLTMQERYRTQIARLSEQLDIKARECRALQQQQKEGEAAQQQRQRAASEISEIGFEQFWQLEGRVINQHLHRVMGKYRLMILDGEIVAVKQVNRVQPRR